MTNLIGLSGKMQTGKNTVADIIQYLTANDSSRQCIRNLGAGISIDGYHNSTWEQKSFAAKLKQCVSIITGIPVEDLEKDEVKNSSLGLLWLVKNENWCDKDMIEFEGGNMDDFEYVPHTGMYRYTKLDHTPTVREILQRLGTDVCREITPNFWINALFADYKPISFDPIDERVVEDFNIVDGFNPIYPNWIITDVRFPNELKAIKDRGGIVIRVNREVTGLKPIVYKDHPSETSLDNATFDYVVNNNGTIDDLIVKIKEILIKEKII